MPSVFGLSSLVFRLRPAVNRLLLVLLCWWTSGVAYAQGEAPLAPLVVAQGQTTQGDIATTSQAIVVDGEVLGDVTTWGGDITINGHVSGDVVSYSGNVTLGGGAQVDGKVFTVGGTVARPASAQIVAGQVIAGAPGGSAVFGLIDLFVPSGTEAAAVGPALRGAFGLAGALVLLALATFGTLLWPRRSAVAVAALRTAPWRAAALGALTTLLLALLLLPLGALLAVTLVGMSLLLPLLLVLHLPYVFGLAAMGQLLGRRLFPTLGSLASSGGVLLLLLPLLLVGIVAPAAALVLFYAIAGTGLGAAILSRGGTLAY